MNHHRVTFLNELTGTVALELPLSQLRLGFAQNRKIDQAVHGEFRCAAGFLPNLVND